MQTVLIFIVFLGPLIFFHELGHFLFAKFFKVRVDVFSIGFGPKIFKYKYGETEYALSVIPFGGYVKMFGDDPNKIEEITDAEKKFSFLHKSKLERFVIVFGGPLANFILAFGIFYLLFLFGEKVPEIRFGHIQNGSIFYGKQIHAGDALKKINESEVFGPAEIDIDPDTIVSTITVERDEQMVVLPIAMKGGIFVEELMKYPPLLRKPIFVNGQGEKFALSAKPDEQTWETSLEELSYFTGTQKLYLFSAKGNDAFSISRNSEKSLEISMDGSRRFEEILFQQGYYPLDLLIRSVTTDSPAVKSGVTNGDIIVSVDGKNIYGFEELRETLQQTNGLSVDIGIIRQGKLESYKVIPTVQDVDGKSTKLIGVLSSLEYLQGKMVFTGSRGLFKSFPMAIERTWSTMVKVFSGFKRLVTTSDAFKKVGGPIAIAQVAVGSFNTGISYFFQIMALISVNLGILNLLPIPVLDGGHIFFLGIELVNNGPLSRRKMEIAQQVGLSFLLLLMVFAIFNDVSRLF